MAPAPASLTSALSDRYLIERELGAGGMADPVCRLRSRERRVVVARSEATK